MLFLLILTNSLSCLFPQMTHVPQIQYDTVGHQIFFYMHLSTTQKVYNIGLYWMYLSSFHDDTIWYKTSLTFDIGRINKHSAEPGVLYVENHHHLMLHSWHHYVEQTATSQPQPCGLNITIRKQERITNHEHICSSQLFWSEFFHCLLFVNNICHCYSQSNGDIIMWPPQNFFTTCISRGFCYCLC